MKDRVAGNGELFAVVLALVDTGREVLPGGAHGSLRISLPERAESENSWSVSRAELEERNIDPLCSPPGNWPGSGKPLRWGNARVGGRVLCTGAEACAVGPSRPPLE